MKKRIALGLSGGVDSAVSGYLLKEQGHDVVGIFLKTYEAPDSYTGECSWKEDLAAAQSVAEHLSIPFETWNFEKEYRATVLEYFFDELRKGRTPNPDSVCNTDIKFGIFLSTAIQKGFDAIATGHYARLRKEGSIPVLVRGRDHAKDQSYFLSRVHPERFEHVLFPLGEMQKEDVRAVAKKIKLPNAERPDSQGICFLGIQDINDFINYYIEGKNGDIVDEHGAKLSKHNGLEHYTVGQRQGIGIGGSGDPYYVAKKNIASNELVVVRGRNHPLLYSKKAKLESVEFYTQKIDILHTWFDVQIRYRQKPQKAKLTPLDHNNWALEFSEPQRAITPGQVAAIYSEDMRAGSGIISETLRSTISI